MSKNRKWDEKDLIQAVKMSGSIRQVLLQLHLKEAGGNYVTIKQEIAQLKLQTTHWHGQAWNKGKKVPKKTLYPLKDILKRDSSFQSFKLKKRLFNEKIKKPQCEICGWAQKSSDGRIPVELDHINGDRRDNRINNLRILCPNCHSLQTTHRGKNIRSRGGGIGRREGLKHP